MKGVTYMLFGMQESENILHEYLNKLENSNDIGIFSGLTKLDKILIPIADSEFVTILGRPSNGKSVLTVHYMRQAALDYKLHKDKYAPPIMISLESPVEEIMLRNLSNYSAMDSRQIRTGRTLNDWAMLHENASKMVAEYPMIIMGYSAFSKKKKERMTIGFIEDGAKKVADKFGLPPRALGLDYIQLCSLDKNVQDRRIMINECVLRYKEMGQIYSAPTIMAAQASREAETQQKFPIPQAHHCKESGAIEECTDILLSVMRPIKYWREGEPVPYSQDGQIVTKDLFFIFVTKQRNGESNVGAWVSMDGRLSSLSDLEMSFDDE